MLIVTDINCFFVVYEFSVQCNTEGFCCGNPYKKEILLKVSLIAQSLPGILFPSN